MQIKLKTTYDSKQDKQRPLEKLNKKVHTLILRRSSRITTRNAMQQDLP